MTSTIKSLAIERQRLVRALRLLPPTDVDKPLLNLSCARMEVDDKCTACGVCARICPTGALKYSASEDDTYRLSFTCAACIDCGACLKVCRPAALQRADATLGDVLSTEAIILREGTLRACTQCGARFAADIDGELCFVCEFRRANPSGSRLPPRVIQGTSAVSS